MGDASEEHVVDKGINEAKSKMAALERELEDTKQRMKEVELALADPSNATLLNSLKGLSREELLEERKQLRDELKQLREKENLLLQLQLKQPGLAGDEAARGAPLPAADRIEELLKRARVDFNPNVVRRMHERFSSRVTNALLQNDSQLAHDTYIATLNLPSTTTVQQLNLCGLQLNGPLFESNDNIIIGYQGLRTKVVKVLDENESQRIRIFQAAVCDPPGSLHHHIVPFELINSGAHYLMVMPKLSTTLEPISSLATTEADLLVSNIGDALGFLHSLGFAHGDVKPSNIAVREGPEVCDFVLIDLGSIVSLGQTVASTKAYVPRDLQQPVLRSTRALDVWMLGMTLSQKACGGYSVDCGMGATDKSTSELLNHLESYLPGPVKEKYKQLLSLAEA